MPKTVPPRDRTAFGRRLLESRKRAKLTQEAVSKATGISQSALSELELTGESSGYTAQLAALYGVSAQWLADESGPMLAPSPSVRRRAAYVAEQLEKIADPDEFDRACVLCESFASIAQAGQLQAFSRLIELASPVPSPTPAPAPGQSSRTDVSR